MICKVLFFLFLWVYPSQAPDPRIIDGQTAQNGQFPYAVAIAVEKSTSQSYFCGGAIINNYWIVTAAHCISDAINITIFTGVTDLTTAKASDIHKAAKYVNHPDFSPTTLNFDVGLIQLETPLTFTDSIKPVALTNQLIGESELVTVMGWGTTSDSATTRSDVLQYVQLSTMSNLDCMKSFPTLTDNMVCARGNGNQGTCKNDGGSPLVQITSTGHIHVGVSIFHGGLGCETTHPSGFFRTFDGIEWIKSITGSSSTKLFQFSMYFCLAFTGFFARNVF